MHRNRSEYYRLARQRAAEVRSEHGLSSLCVRRNDLRRIYRACGIDHCDLWPPKGHPRSLAKLRGAYFDDENGCSVMVARGLPDEPAIFTMAHELKHHLMDREIGPVLMCHESNVNAEVEIAAEIFAAELMFPDASFRREMAVLGVGEHACTAEALVHLKHRTRTTLSYAGIVKKAEFLGYAVPGSLPKQGWRKLEERLYGEPLYKTLLRRRASNNRA